MLSTSAALNVVCTVVSSGRSPHDQEVLWQALLDGVIDFIATDHAPPTLEEKAKGYP
ncbi:MAG TPA: hypothetical protein V6C78_04365 [Crinalium sp.]